MNKASRGRFGLDKATEIQQSAKNSFGIVLASSSFALIIRQYLEQLKSLETSIVAFDEEIARIMATFDTKLETITGIGKTLAAVIDGRMSKRGSPYLRRAVWLAANVAAFNDPTISTFYQKKRSEGKDHLTVIGHVCHKILAIIFAVLRDNKTYLPASAS